MTSSRVMQNVGRRWSHDLCTASFCLRDIWQICFRSLAGDVGTLNSTSEHLDQHSQTNQFYVLIAIFHTCIGVAILFEWLQSGCFMLVLIREAGDNRQQACYSSVSRHTCRSCHWDNLIQIRWWSVLLRQGPCPHQWQTNRLCHHEARKQLMTALSIPLTHQLPVF